MDVPSDDSLVYGTSINYGLSQPAPKLEVGHVRQPMIGNQNMNLQNGFWTSSWPATLSKIIWISSGSDKFLCLWITEISVPSSGGWAAGTEMKDSFQNSSGMQSSTPLNLFNKACLSMGATFDCNWYVWRRGAYSWWILYPSQSWPLRSTAVELTAVRSTYSPSINAAVAAACS